MLSLSPGVILSQSSLHFQLDGSPLDTPYSVEQVIQYNECAYSQKNVSTSRLKVARNFISYESREKILRYAMTNKISPLGGMSLHSSGCYLSSANPSNSTILTCMFNTRFIYFLFIIVHFISFFTFLFTFKHCCFYLPCLFVILKEHFVKG